MYGGFELHYGCDREALGELGARFAELDLDEAGRSYLRDVLERRHGWWKTKLHGLLTSVASDFDVNGLLSMYQMHLLSTEQWRLLLGEDARGSWLDIGAGSGDVTAHAAPLFDILVTTEVSWVMSRRLRQRGFACRRVDVSQEVVPGGPYHVVSCMNVLDRCLRPITLLERARDAVEPGGRLMFALALPYNAWVYDGPSTIDPLEVFDCGSGSFEQVTRRIGDVVLPSLGLEVERLSRAPYLSAGDTNRALYVLDDAVFVCRKAGDFS